MATGTYTYSTAVLEYLDSVCLRAVASTIYCTRTAPLAAPRVPPPATNPRGRRAPPPPASPRRSPAHRGGPPRPARPAGPVRGARARGGPVCSAMPRVASAGVAPRPKTMAMVAFRLAMFPLLGAFGGAAPVAREHDGKIGVVAPDHAHHQRTPPSPPGGEGCSALAKYCPPSCPSRFCSDAPGPCQFLLQFPGMEVRKVYC
jgi:hypothetical protein